MSKLNPDKTEFIILSNAQLKRLDSHLLVRLFGNFIKSAVVVNILGIWFHTILPLLIIYFINILRLILLTCVISGWLRQYLTDEATILVVNASVDGSLDYCYSLFRSLHSFNMFKLQCIQNTFAWIVTNCIRYTQASLPKRLHSLHLQNAHFGSRVSSQWSSQLLRFSFVYS